MLAKILRRSTICVVEKNYLKLQSVDAELITLRISFWCIYKM